MDERIETSRGSAQPIHSVEPSIHVLDSTISSQIPPVLKQFLLVILGATVACLLIEVFAGRILHLGYPYNWPLMFPDVSFMDFATYFDQFHRLHTAAFFEGPDILMYPAPVVVCYWLFYFLQPVATSVFVGFILATSFTAGVLVARALAIRGLSLRLAIFFVAVVYLLSYPLWFELKQANMEIIVWLVLTCALYCFARKRYKGAAVLIGIAAALKFYPIIYLGILLARKRYRECVLACLVAVSVTVASLWLIGPTIPIAWHGTQAGLALFRQNYMLPIRRNEIGFDHSLFALIKSLLGFAKRAGILPSLSDHAHSLLLSAYLATSAIVGTILYFIRIRFLPAVNQLVCIVVASILLPPVSYDYTLLHLYAPWLLLVFLALSAYRCNLEIRGLRAAFICIALALSPWSELILGHERAGGELRSIFLLALFMIGLYFPFSFPSHLQTPAPNTIDANFA